MEEQYTKCVHPGCRKEPYAVPVMEIPIRLYPQAAYAMLKGPVCLDHACSFSMNTFTDYEGSWYDAICTGLREAGKPATNPFPDDPKFNWEEFKVDPNWEPAPKSECVLRFWDLKVFTSKGMSQRLW